MMKRAFIVLAIAAIGGVGCKEGSVGMTTAGQSPAAKKHDSLLRHVVLFKFKDDTTAEQKKAIEEAFCALPNKIKAIHDFEWGTDVSTENKAEGFTHCFLVTFKSVADGQAYLPHPAHKQFVEILRPRLDKVLVIDYWTKEYNVQLLRR